MLDTSLSFNQTVKGITEFIEVAIHAILYSRHPALNEYISGATQAIADELVLGNIQKVVVVIKDKDQVPLERFIFSVQNMIEVETHNMDVSVQEAMSSATLCRYFRAFLVKLNMIESQLVPLEPQDESTFAILLELRDDREVPTGLQDEMNQDPPPWVPADKQYTTAGTPDNTQLHLLRTVETGIVNVALAVQESEEKLRRIKELRKDNNSGQNGEANDKPA
ncbi:DNA-binding protein [Chiua virens]|nr:DNA-binding protein [Chiua virens]